MVDTHLEQGTDVAIVEELDDRVADMACTAVGEAEQVSPSRELMLKKTLCGYRNPRAGASDASLIRIASSEDGLEVLEDSHAEMEQAVAGSLVVEVTEEAGHDCMGWVKRAAVARLGQRVVEDSLPVADEPEPVVVVSDAVAVRVLDHLGSVLTALV